MTQPTPRDELYAYATVAFKEDGVPPIVDQHVTRMLNAYRGAVLREAANALDADMERFFAEWPDEPRNSPYANGRKDAATELRRMAEEARS
ncbi:hypothetical protein [Streptomyces gardneri]|uniref:hypothetical protein n=1 Tax=Streptomyces gardneri TaxID=66892 RepID=UPI0036B92AE5